MKYGGYKPVLFPGVVSPRVSLSNLSGQHSHNIHKQDKVELKEKRKAGYCCAPSAVELTSDKVHFTNEETEKKNNCCFF